MKLTSKAARINVGLKQEDVAKLVGVSRTTVSYWETGRHVPIYTHKMALAEIYKVDIEDLIFNEK